MNNLTHILKKLAPYFALSLLCFALYLPGIASIPMDDRDSAHFAQATRQMLETGNYFQIHYQDVVRYQKPPGINWLQAISVKIFSHPESNKVWPYRLPSVMGAWLSVLLTYILAKRFTSSTAAWVAAALLACTILLNVEAHMAVIDTSLLSTVILMQGALWVIYDKTRQGKSVHWGWGLLFFLSMSCGILLKGVTLLIGLLTLVTLSIVDRTTRYFTALRWPVGMVLLILTSAGWLIGVSYAEHSNYLMEMLHHDLFPKLAGGHESHGGYLGTHLVLLFVTFWPASLFLLPTSVRTWKYRRGPLEKFLLAWILPTWIFFEIMPTKLPQYILPVFPALVILTANTILAFNVKDSMSYPKMTRYLIIFWSMVSFALALAVIEIPHFLHMSIHTTAMKMAFVSMGLLAFTAMLAATYMHQSQDTNNTYLRVFWTLVIGSVLSFGVAFQWFLPALQPIWTSQQIAGTMTSYATDDQHPLGVIGYGEPSLVFVQGTHRVQFKSVKALVPMLNAQREAQDHTTRYILVDNHFNADFLQTMQANVYTVTSLKTFHTFNYNKGHWINLTLYSVLFP